MPTPEPSLYGAITIVALLLGAWLWQRRIRSEGPERFGIFIGGMIGAFLGAKIVYLLSEGWLHLGEPDFWYQAAVGKTILGALLGGYAGVEITKKLVGSNEPTGDWFALVVPGSIAAGRIGCLRHGCCLGEVCNASKWYAMTDQSGIARWPAVPLELMFNLLALALLFQLRRAKSLRGQLFHLYLIGYGAFRFVHESARGTPKVIGETFSGYHIAALGVFALGIWRFIQRRSSFSDAELGARIL